MSEKLFRVRFEQEDGRGEIVNEKGVELTAREVVELLNEQQATITRLGEENEQLKKQNIEYEEVQCKIMNYIIDKGLGSEFAKFLRENM